MSCSYASAKSQTGTLKSSITHGDSPKENKLNPLHIKEKHWDEWINFSHINPKITSLNLVSLEGDQVLNRLLVSDNLPRLNTGRVSNSVYQKYLPLERGGWWCNGVDVLDLPHLDLWGQFKGDHPRLYSQETGSQSVSFQPIKYDAPP